MPMVKHLADPRVVRLPACAKVFIAEIRATFPALLSTVKPVGAMAYALLARLLLMPLVNVMIFILVSHANHSFAPQQLQGFAADPFGESANKARLVQSVFA